MSRILLHYLTNNGHNRFVFLGPLIGQSPAAPYSFRGFPNVLHAYGSYAEGAGHANQAWNG